MQRFLQLAAAALFMTGATTARTQISNPGTLVAPAPRNPAQHGPEKKVYDLQWLWQYVDHKPALDADPRFRLLLDTHFRAPQAFWSTPGSPLADAARAFLAGPGSVTATGNRYLTVTGCVVDPAPDADTKPCSQRGLLWIDLGRPQPLLVFAALRWTEEGKAPGQGGVDYNLWLFPSQQLDPQAMPDPLKRELEDWARGEEKACSEANNDAAHIPTAVVVDPAGTPNVIGAATAGVPSRFCVTTTTNDPVTRGTQ